MSGRCRRNLRIGALALALMTVALLVAPSAAIAMAPPKASGVGWHYDWTKITVLAFFGPLALFTIAILWSLGLFYPHCPLCRGRVWVREETRVPATQEHAGVAVRIRECRNCGWHSEKESRLPILTNLRGSYGTFLYYEPRLPVNVAQPPEKHEAPDADPKKDA